MAIHRPRPTEVRRECEVINEFQGNGAFMAETWRWVHAGIPTLTGLKLRAQPRLGETSSTQPDPWPVKRLAGGQMKLTIGIDMASAPYLASPELKERVWPLLGEAFVVRPNKYRVVDGHTIALLGGSGSSPGVHRGSRPAEATCGGRRRSWPPAQALTPSSRVRSDPLVGPRPSRASSTSALSWG